MINININSYKKSNFINFKFNKDYEFAYFWQPTKWMTGEELLSLHKMIQQINTEGPKLNYGILSPTAAFDFITDFYNRSIICVIYKNRHPVGFFYNYYVDENFKPYPIIHSGLVVINKNDGLSLIAYSYMLFYQIMWLKKGVHFLTNISHIPSIVGYFSDGPSKVWPHYSKKSRAPRYYKEVFNKLINQYVYNFFPDSKDIKVDRRRFVLEGYAEKEEMSFEKDIRKLAPYKKMNVNYFCQYWLNYDRGDDLVQVGLLDGILILRSLIFGFKYWFYVEINNFKEFLTDPKINQIPIEYTSPKVSSEFEL